MNNNKVMKALTKAEMEVMNVLWDVSQALTVHEIVAQYPEPQPAYTTVCRASQKGCYGSYLLLFAHAHT